MSELAERVQKLADAMRTADIPIVEDSESIVAIQAQYTTAYCKLIEQALLAERRLAMEEAAKISCRVCAGHYLSGVKYEPSAYQENSFKPNSFDWLHKLTANGESWTVSCGAGHIWRAAAEKEVGK